MVLSIGILHGCRQNADIIENLLKEYTKKIRNLVPEVKFYFLDAQYVHYERGRTWYRTTLDLDKIGMDDIPVTEIENTLDYVEAFVRMNSINCLVGFSQGGNVISTYLRARNSDFHINRAAIIAGYDFPKYTINELPNIKLVLVFSKEDTIVPYELTPISSFSPIIITHDKGHKICTRNSFVTSFVNALLG